MELVMRKLIAWVFMYSLDGLIDELRLDVHPYVAGEGTRLFDGVPASYRLDLVASAEFANGVVGLHDRRPRRRRPSSEQPGNLSARRYGRSLSRVAERPA